MGNSLNGVSIALCDLHMRERELQLAERERALLDLERRWREGEQWPWTSKTAWLFPNYTHSLDCETDYPKSSRKQRRKRRKRPERTRDGSDSISTTSSSYTSASGSTSQLSPPTGLSGTPGPTTSGSADAPPNLIDLNSSPMMLGKNIHGMMATMNITE